MYVESTTGADGSCGGVGKLPVIVSHCASGGVGNRSDAEANGGGGDSSGS